MEPKISTQLQRNKYGTLPESDIAPKNGWLEHDFPFGMTYF